MLKQDIILSDLWTSKEEDQIIRKDASLVANPPDRERYLRMNKDKYHVLLNTWMYMCAQYVGRREVNALMTNIRMNGLLPVISDCSTLASDIIRSDFTLSDLRGYGFLMNEDPRVTLQLLRYPKRFSPTGATALRDSGLKALKGLNFAMRGTPVRIWPDGRVIERSITYPRYLIDRVRYWCANILAFKNIDEKDPLMKGCFSNGVSANGSHTLFEKYKEWAKLTPGYKDNILYPLHRFGNFDAGELPDIDYVKAVAVPKSYKTPRIIAEVSAKCQYHQQGIRVHAIECISQCWARDFIVLDDQTINQEWSRLGSIYGTYATIDLSAASDSISEHLARQVLPHDWYEQISAYNPPYIKIGDEKVKRNIFLTSGSGNTFVLESVIFEAIAMTASEYVSIYYDLPLSNVESNDPEDRSYIRFPRVYGDDIICDTRCYDTVVDFLRKLGFTVNEDKSFSNGGYRESCGAEWYCGLDTATKYFPRKAFDEDSDEYLEGLISLQHRLYEFESCEQWLSNHIKREFRRRYNKEMTSSYPGTECSDLWADYPFYYTVDPPYDHRDPDMAKRTAEWLTIHDVKREAHVSLKRKSYKGKNFEKAFISQYRHPYTWLERQLMELFRYVDFLQHGTPVDEWGVPIHRQDVSDDLLIPEVVWTTLRR